MPIIYDCDGTIIDITDETLDELKRKSYKHGNKHKENKHSNYSYEDNELLGLLFNSFEECLMKTMGNDIIIKEDLKRIKKFLIEHEII